MKPSTKAQRQHIYSLCNFNKELKEDILFQFFGSTEKPITSTKELSFEQANTIIKHLGAQPHVENADFLRFNKEYAQHRYILSLCLQIGWSEQHKVHGKVADLKALATWLVSERAPVRKPLPKQSTVELSKTIAALENMIKKHYAKSKA
jgi:hypothetical protein